MNFKNRVKTEKLILITDLIADPEVGANFISFLSDSREEIEVLEQSDNTLAIRESFIPTIFQKYAQWWGDRLKQKWCNREDETERSELTCEIPADFHPLETIKATLEKALAITGNREIYLKEIVDRTPSGMKLISQLQKYYQEPVNARKHFLKAADELYSKEQGVKRARTSDRDRYDDRSQEPHDNSRNYHRRQVAS